MTTTPDLHAAFTSIFGDYAQHQYAARQRPEPPLRFGDYVTQGRDYYMDDGEIQDAENAYERGMDRWFE